MPDHIEKVKELFDEYGWKAERIDESTLVSGFAGETSTFTLFVKATDDWVVLSISPYVERPPDGYTIELLDLLARLNFRATLVKFSLDDEDNITLTIELPANDLTINGFGISLETLCFYAEDQYGTVLSLASGANEIALPIKEISRPDSQEK